MTKTETNVWDSFSDKEGVERLRTSIANDRKNNTGLFPDLLKDFLLTQTNRDEFYSALGYSDYQIKADIWWRYLEKSYRRSLFEGVDTENGFGIQKIVEIFEKEHNQHDKDRNKR